MLNIALVFEDEVNQLFANMSKELQKTCISTVRLGENSIPHITLLHVDADEADVPVMLRSMRSHSLVTSYNADLGSLVVYPWWNERFYTVVSVEGSHVYMKLQDFVMRTVPQFSVVSEIGADYEPHVTLACMEDKFKRDKIRPTRLPIRRVEAKLVIGTRDSYGRMERILDYV